jgi:hypothetical protein
VLRRFDFKLKFEFLKAEQGWKLFQRYMDSSGLEINHLRDQFNQMNTLTPGDFATVGRQLGILGKATQPQEFITALQQELKFKQTLNRPIGFTTKV